jgi:hypothetical protein
VVPHADRPQPPADQGLSSLGLIMTLAGSVMAPMVAALLLIQIQVSAHRSALLSDSTSSITLWLFLILIAGLVRSMVHRMAGLRLWRDAPNDPPALSGITTYVIAAGAHTALICLFLKIHDSVPASMLLGTAVFLMAWPLAVFLVTRLPRFQALGARPPLAEDNGFEGLAVLMAILGFAGLVCSVMVVVIGVSMRDEDKWAANVLILCGAALVVRSIIHLSVGARGLRGTAVAAARDFLRYGDVGIAIGAAVGGGFTLYTFTESLELFALVRGIAITLALMAWPAIVRRFVSWRHLADVASDNVRRRSPDFGVTALGWLLLAGAAYALGSYLASVLWESEVRARSTQLVLKMGGTPWGVQDTHWWTLPLGLGQLWAALELLAVTPRRRVVASLWGLAAVAVALVEKGPHLGELLDLPLILRAAGFAIFFLGITPAVATLLLVNRPTIPSAVARVKPG